MMSDRIKTIELYNLLVIIKKKLIWIFASNLIFLLCLILLVSIRADFDINGEFMSITLLLSLMGIVIGAMVSIVLAIIFGSTPFLNKGHRT